MNIEFTNKKQKRPRPSFNESANSFVRNVKSRVSGLLPATITKWFSSPSSSGNGSAPAADCSDSSTDDETCDSPITQPLAKRMRFTHSGSKFNQYTPPEPTAPNLVDNTEQNQQKSHSVLYNSIQSPTGSSTFVQEPNYMSTSYISPAEVSNIEIGNNERTDRDLTYKTPHIVTVSSPSVATKRKSIFEMSKKPKEVKKPFKSCAQATTKAPKETWQPTYRAALFGSPFYPGRTMYGGASSSTYINHANIKQQKTVYVKEAPKDNNLIMSTSARRVMDLLENYSSPLLEARRIPVICTNTSVNDTSASNTSKPMSHKTQELYVSSMASILRLKQRSRLMDTTKAARQIIASHSSTLSGFQPYEADTPKSTPSQPADKESTTKLKTRITRQNRGEKHHEMPEPVELPTAVLQIDQNNLPKFSISGPSSTSLPTLTSPTPKASPFSSNFASQNSSVGSVMGTVSKDTTPETRAGIFQFASPVAISSTNSHVNNTTPLKFSFGSPERSIDKPKPVEETKALQPHGFSFNTQKKETTVITSAFGNTLKQWKCPGCWSSNKPEQEKCPCCGAKPATDDPQANLVEKCTVCKFASRMASTDKCINCEKASTQDKNSVPLPIPQPADPSKWKCEACWGTNEEKAETCPACGNMNPKLVDANAQKKDKPEEKLWRCEDCWIGNKISVDKCAACGGSKPVDKEKVKVEPAPQPEFHSPFNKPQNDKFSEIVRAQKDKWMCSSCLVWNDSNKTQCMCCEMEREGPSKEITSKPFTFPKESNVTFKFGIDPKEQEINIAKKAEPVFKLEPTRKLEEPESNNNNIPTATFSLPSKLSAEKLPGVLPVDKPKMAFSFGVPKPSTTSTMTLASPAFGVKTTTAPTVEEPQEKQNVNFSAPAQEAPKPFGAGFFSSPSQPSHEASPKPFTSFSMPSSTPAPTTAVKEAPITPSPFLATPAPSTEKPKTFSFSVDASSSNSNIFGASSAAATTSAFTFGTPQQSTPTTTAAPSVPLFQSPTPSAAPIAAPAITMFGSSQPAPALAPAPAAAPAVAPAPAPTPMPAPASTAAAPLFSFGNSAQSTAPAASDKPNFNFSFGNTVTTESSLFGTGFKPTFGSTSNNSTSNAFNMPTPAPLPSSDMTAAMAGASDTNDGMSSGMEGFGAPAKENVWGASSTATSNVFGSSSSVEQKPAQFMFSSANPFNSTATPAAVAAPAPSPSLFGNQQPAQNVFGLMTPSNSGPQAQLFGSPAPSSQPATLFGAQSAPSMFGTSNTAPAFNALAQPAPPQYEANSMTPAQAPSFSFGAQSSAGVFGFGAQQQQQQQQPQPQQMYNFGTSGMGGVNQGMGAVNQGMSGMNQDMSSGNQGMGGMNQDMSGMNPGMSGGMMSQPLGGGMLNQPMGGVQFAMGSAPASNGRRLRKAVRRNTPR